MESAGKVESGLENPAFVPDSSNDRKKSQGGGSITSGDYEPYSQRVLTLPTTNLETLLHLIKGSMGSGILAMPNAFKNAGYVFGAVATIAIGVICTYTVHLLVQSSYALCKRRKVPSMGYPETMEAAMRDGPGYFPKIAPYAEYIVNFFIFLFQVGTCCVYFVFISSNIQRVMGEYINEIDVRLYMCMIFLPIALLNLVRKLKYLAPFSALSNFLIVTGVAITLYYIFRDGLPDISQRNWIGEARGIPLFFGTVLFALECIGVIMPLENNMKTPKSFGGPTGVFNQAMLVIIFLYTSLGLFGYLEYGEKIEGSITLNLPNNEILAQVVQIMMAVAIFLTYPLQCYVAVDILWNTYLSPKVQSKKRKLAGEYGVRTGIVLLTFGLAVAIPNLELFISLVGALALSMVGIILPPIIAMATFEHQRRGWRIYKNIAIVIFGILGMLTGTYVSIVDIVHSLSSSSSSL
ncbi:proton-coupled amino acid transporter-like protein CG1139 [Cloeon dipterum]|uniref:proton-coupled amino acid transporter-like protein CG1139 n=1 Tax=Cloeon dipterum TaxID=197152 RepID=UPI00321FE15C